MRHSLLALGVVVATCALAGCGSSPRPRAWLSLEEAAGAPGDTVTVNLRYRADTPLWRVDACIAHDPKVLRLVDAELGEYKDVDTDSFSGWTDDPASGWVFYVRDNAESSSERETFPADTEFTIGRLVYEVLPDAPAGPTDLRFQNRIGEPTDARNRVLDVAEEPAILTTVDGSIQIDSGVTNR